MKSQLKTVELKGNGKAISLIPEHSGPQVLVDATVLKRLVNSLQRSTFSDVKENLMQKLELAGSREELNSIMSSELAFSKTISIMDVTTADQMSALLDLNIQEKEEAITDQNIASLVG